MARMCDLTVVLCAGALLCMVSAADALKCYECLHQVYKADDDFTQAIMDAAGAYTNEPKCMKNGIDFTDNPPTGRTTCSVACSKVYSSFEMEYFGSKLTGETWARGCVDDMYEGDGCVYDLEEFLKGQDFGGATITGGTACGCSDKDLCNAGSHVTITSLTLILAAMATAFLKF